MTPTAPIPGLNYRSPKEAARVAGVSLQTLRRWAKSGGIPHYRTPGGHHRYCIDLMMRHREPHATEPLPAPAPVETVAQAPVLKPTPMSAAAIVAKRMDAAALQNRIDRLAVA